MIVFDFKHADTHFKHADTHFKHADTHGRGQRRGFSLIEVMIAAMMTSLVVLFAATVSVDIGRGFISGVADARIATEFRLLGETLRRDFSGSLPDVQLGGPKVWRFVGRDLISSEELRLCFDAQDDGSVDWAGSDRVITYWLDGEQLIRTDETTGVDFVVCDNVSDLEFGLDSGEIRINVELTFGQRVEAFRFDTPDVS